MSKNEIWGLFFYSFPHKTFPSLLIIEHCSYLKRIPWDDQISWFLTLPEFSMIWTHDQMRPMEYHKVRTEIHLVFGCSLWIYPDLIRGLLGDKVKEVVLGDYSISQLCQRSTHSNTVNKKDRNYLKDCLQVSTKASEFLWRSSWSRDAYNTQLFSIHSWHEVLHA